MDEQVDVIVLGMGVGGEEVALKTAEAGLAVVGIEDRLLGGECPYFACVPTKMMVRGSDLLADGRRIPGMAGDSSVTPDWTPVARRIRDEATDNWDDKVAVDRFEGKGGRFIRGRGRIEARDRVSVGDRTFVASKAVVIATGTDPAIPPIEGLRDVPFWTNRDVVKVEHVPSSLTVLGAGPVGLEIAQVFQRFGTRVTVVEAAARVLPAEEPESSELVHQALLNDGITLRLGVSAQRASQNGDGIAVALADGSTVTSQRLLVATGRRIDLRAIHVRDAGLDDDAHCIRVDEHLRAAPGIWAVGDITGVAAFTHTAIYQARIAAADILGREHAPADYRALPRVTFTDPEVGATGLGESQARERGINVRTGLAHVETSTRGWIHKVDNHGIIKLIEDADRGVLVGATSVGPVGGEVLSMLIVAVHAEVPVSRLRTMITAYPTFHRAVDDALDDLG